MNWREQCRLLPDQEEGAERAKLRKVELRYTAPDGVHISDDPKLLLVKHNFGHPIEVRLGQEAGGRQRLFLIRGRECAQLGAAYVLIQPDVVAEDPRRGWLPLGDRHPTAICLGLEESPELELGGDVGPDHSDISVTAEGVFISDGSGTGTDVWVHPEDVLRTVR